MNKRIYLVTAVVWGLAASTAFAQGRDHRRKVPKPRAPGATPTFSPRSGPAGTVVTVRGMALRQVTKVSVGPADAKVDSARKRNLTFTIPDFKKSGPRKVVLHAGNKQIELGEFTVTVGDTPAPVPDPGGPDTQGHGRGTHRPMPGHGPPRKRFPHRDHTTVSGYAPDHGAPGTEVVIRGRNFTPDMELLFSGKPVASPKVTPRRISFKVPKGSGDGMIKLMAKDNPRPIVVGGFDVKRKWNPRERKQARKDMRSRAEKRWRERRAKLAKDKAERKKQLAEREREMRDHRAERRQKRVAELRAKWQLALLSDPEVLAELSRHAERVARLQQMLRLAEADDRGELVIRIDVAMERENKRHDTRMATLKTAIESQ